MKREANMNTLIILAFVFAGLESLALWKGWHKLEYLVKPTVMVCLFIWLYATAGLGGALLWFGIGLLFSLAGDIALLFIDRFFILGLVAFLLGHIAYLIGFNTPLPQTTSAWSFLLAIVIGLGSVRVLRRIAGSMRTKGQTRLVIPVLIYGTVITLMLLAAMLTLFRLDWEATAAVLVSLGAALFYFSDILLAWHRFVAPIKNGRMLNIGMYHLAQIAIVVGVAMQFR
jgi:alkenylglycerophosphocholine/alkenylglycerophosphoethanolamine hydrolase